MSEHFDGGGLALPGGGRGMGVPGAPRKGEIVREEHLLRKVSYPWGEDQRSWAKASDLGDGLSDTGGDRVAGQELPCWGRGTGVLNLGG